MRTKTLVCYALSCTSTLSVVLMILALFLYEEDFLSKFTEEDYFLTSLTKPESTAIMFYTFETNPKDLDYNWERLEEAIRDDEKLNHISVKKIECTVFKPLCSKFEVDNYPTIAWMQRGKITETFEGDKTSFKSLKSFVDRMSQEQAKTTEITTEIPTDVTEISMTDTETTLSHESSIFDETTVESPVEEEEFKSTKHVHFAPEDSNIPRSSTDRMDPMYYHPKMFPKNQPSSSPVKFNPKIPRFSEENGKSFYRKDKSDFGKKTKSTPFGKKFEAPSSSSSENNSKSSHKSNEHSRKESMSFEHSGSHSKSYHKKHPDSNVGRPFERPSTSDSKSKSRSYETREEFSESNEGFSKSKSVESNEDHSPTDSNADYQEEKSKSSSALSSSHSSGSNESTYKKDVITEILKKDKTGKSLEKASKSSENVSNFQIKEIVKSTKKSEPKEATKSLKDSNVKSTSKVSIEKPVTISTSKDAKSKPISTEDVSKSGLTVVEAKEKSIEKASMEKETLKSTEVNKGVEKDEIKSEETPTVKIESSKKSSKKESNKKDFKSQEDQKSLEKVKVESKSFSKEKEKFNQKQESTLKSVDSVKSSKKSIQTKSKVSSLKSQQNSEHSKIKSTIKNQSPSRSVALNKSSETHKESKSTKISKPKSTNVKNSGLEDKKLVKNSKNNSDPSIEKPAVQNKSENKTVQIPDDSEDSSDYDEDYFEGQTINFADLFKSVEDDKSGEKIDTSEEMEIVRYFPSSSSEHSSEEEEKEMSDEEKSKEEINLNSGKTNLTEEVKKAESNEEKALKEIPKVVNEDTQEEKVINLEVKVKDEIPTTIKEAPIEVTSTTEKILIQDIPIQKDESKEKEVKVQNDRTRHRYEGRDNKDRTQRNG